ncbi:hypothetical protein ElyMa_003842800 [Elysia marginata]|uniref:Uncharacterized protein n=1 Tax=Elysia marginata TaxID=1093978 RepID=A0AAV4FGY1_9GAST|nr:hypothetical protein ElyMa_003842800 [Elysia marginata]
MPPPKISSLSLTFTTLYPTHTHLKTRDHGADTDTGISRELDGGGPGLEVTNERTWLIEVQVKFQTACRSYGSLAIIQLSSFPGAGCGTSH